jgi:prepilin-type N-terminal cleavage/methylation domain-containing protein
MRQSGKTLIEILVVIVIIALLAALVVGGVFQVRSYVKRASCASNLRQIYIVLKSYVEDYEAPPPPFILRERGSQEIVYHWQVLSLYQPNLKPLRCVLPILHEVPELAGIISRFPMCRHISYTTQRMCHSRIPTPRLWSLTDGSALSIRRTLKKFLSLVDGIAATQSGVGHYLRTVILVGRSREVARLTEKRRTIGVPSI